MKNFLAIFCLWIWGLPMFMGAQPLCSTQRYQDSVFASVSVHQDIYFGTVNPYGLSASQDLFLDLYEPDGDTLAHRPMILFAFGGSFLAGNKRQPIIPEYCDYFAKRGYVVTAIDYRTGFNVLSGGSSERAVYRGVQDIRAALRYLAEHSDSLRIDTNFIFLTGTSAGCIAGIHSAYFQSDERPTSTFGITGESQDLGGADSSGNSFYQNRRVPVRGLINHWGAIGDTSWIDPTLEDRIPCISFHGTSDNTVPFDKGKPYGLPFWPDLYGSNAMATRFNNIGVPHQLVAWEGVGHEPELADRTYLDTMFLMATPFVYELLRPQPPVILGNTLTCAENIERYTSDAPHTCWEVTGGQIVGSGMGYVDIVWADSLGPHEVHATGVNNLLVPADTRQTVAVLVTPPLTAIFGYSVQALTVTFQDSSASAAYRLWDFGDGTTDTTQIPIHLFADTGWHTITLIIGNAICSDTLVQDIYIPPFSTGIASHMRQAGFQLFPNPAKESVTLILPETITEMVEVTLMNTQGKRVHHQKILGAAETQIARNEIPAGLYLVIISTKTSTYYSKLLFY